MGCDGGEPGCFGRSAEGALATILMQLGTISSGCEGNDELWLPLD